jgi:hypothetical protein
MEGITQRSRCRWEDDIKMDLKEIRRKIHPGFKWLGICPVGHGFERDLLNCTAYRLRRPVDQDGCQNLKFCNDSETSLLYVMQGMFYELGNL